MSDDYFDYFTEEFTRIDKTGNSPTMHADYSPCSAKAKRHRYGIRWMPTWPHINLGISIHLSRKFGHVSLHLPIGVLVIGFIGKDGVEQ